MKLTIPFNKPFIGEEEIQAVQVALKQDVLRGDGPISRRVQKTMQDWLNVRHVNLTTSCTHALEMAMITLGITPGDEVIMPSFTFVSTANAVVLRGAKPVFAEVLPDTLNIDPEDIKRRITKRTKAIIPVHYAGVACNMDAIMSLAKEHNLHVVEDAAQGVDALYKGRYLGTIGHIGCYSFHDTKNIVCGEGGAFLTSNDGLAHQAELVREKGTNRSAFLRGEIDKYTWVDRGSSYIQSDILAAVLEVQISKRKEIKHKRKLIWEFYYETLRPLADDGLVVLPVVPFDCEPNHHLFFFRVSSEKRRNELLSELKTCGIGATFHYVPLHSSPFGRKSLFCTYDLPITDRISSTLIRLPLYPQLTDKVEYVANKVFSILRESKLVPVTT